MLEAFDLKRHHGQYINCMYNPYQKRKTPNIINVKNAYHKQYTHVQEIPLNLLPKSTKTSTVSKPVIFKNLIQGFQQSTQTKLLGTLPLEQNTFVFTTDSCLVH